MESVLLAFVTGLTTGGISCLAVQGGLLTSGLASQVKLEEEDASIHLNKTQYILIFLVTKFVGLFFVGALLGAFGSVMLFSPKITAYLHIAVGIFMLATVGNLLQIHPIFRYAVIRPPKLLLKSLHKMSKTQSSYVAPVTMGLLAIVLPCGVTQMMMASAVSSANFFTGGLIMGGFALGTSPLFFGLGLTASKILTHKLLTFGAAVVIFYLGIQSINSGLVLSGSPYTLKNIYQVMTLNSNGSTSQQKEFPPMTEDGKQNVSMLVTSTNYVPNFTQLKAGIPVRLTLTATNATGCIRAFSIPSLNITKILPETGTDTLEFVPEQPGTLRFSCNMGMYTGEFLVI